ncbi:hypothetical protein DFP72DRAFT_860441 [Ephemerocybe angulata]|uniref:Uncharacterized protein n=1 Tax=Ephemerocybe angulata TaxID=980116 RepID=A0A8H6HAW9_9AGAR|nr:hypothetical protein DFP72DRAFT_860441 [Tulosesus angulatus]
MTQSNFRLARHQECRSRIWTPETALIVFDGISPLPLSEDLFLSFFRHTGNSTKNISGERVIRSSRDLALTQSPPQETLTTLKALQTAQGNQWACMRGTSEISWLSSLFRVEGSRNVVEVYAITSAALSPDFTKSPHSAFWFDRVVSLGVIVHIIVRL